MGKNSKLSLVYLLLVFVFLYVPILCVVAYSFNASRSAAAWGGFTWDWYVAMTKDRRLMDALWVSLQVGVCTAFLSAILGTLSAVAFGKLHKRLAAALNGLMYIPLIIPEIIMGVALLMFFALIPHIQYGIATLILSHMTFCVPYVFVLVSIRLRTIDPSIPEAARDLGAKGGQVFRTVTLPLILPSVISGGLLALAMSLDDVVISFFLSGPTSTTLPVKIYSMLKLGVTPEINALCTAMLLVTFLVVGILQIGNNLGARRKRQ